MTMDKVCTNVEGISYTFLPDSTLDIYIDIYPNIQLNSSSTLRSIPIDCLDCNSDFILAKGDSIELSVSERNKPLLKISNGVIGERSDVRLTHCPMCGQLLLIDQYNNRKCINRCCNGQLPQTILMFLSSLGITLQGSNYQIFSSLLARDRLHSIVDLFALRWEQLVTDNITSMNAQVFIQYIHSMRGNVSIDRFLRGLNIPGMTCTTIEQIRELFIANNFSLLDLPTFFDPAVTAHYPGIDWVPWHIFTSLDVNRQLVHVLGTILYI